MGWSLTFQGSWLSLLAARHPTKTLKLLNYSANLRKAGHSGCVISLNFTVQSRGSRFSITQMCNLALDARSGDEFAVIL